MMLLTHWLLSKMIEASTPDCIIHIHILQVYRLRLPDGGYVYMDWHNYCGPTFYRDRDLKRVIWEWYEDWRICRALDWFTGRGCKA